MNSVICCNFVFAMCFVFLLSYGVSKASPRDRCRPGSMSCRLGRNEMPAMLGNQLALRNSLAAEDGTFEKFNEETYNVQDDKYGTQRKQSKLQQKMDNIF
ncbi:hypothetical protein ACROYT_G033375 [Oculina patagonica]